MAKRTSKFLQGRRIDPAPITPDTSIAELVDEAFLAYNGARLREACQLFALKMLRTGSDHWHVDQLGPLRLQA